MGDSTFHSALSPSGRHRWGVCPGSVREEAKFPEDPGGHAANDGTRTHTLLEQLVKYEFIQKQGQCGPLPYVNSTITDEFGTYTVDAERARRLNVAMEYIRDFVSENGGTVIAETRVFPDGLVGRADMSGTVDVQIASKFVYVVMDYKDGMSQVAAKGNPQLEQYALGVLAGLAPENYPKKFRLVIVQPKLAMKGLPVISTHEMTLEEVSALGPVMAAEAAATDAPDAPLVPGDSQCKYCKAQGSCSAVLGKLAAEVGLMMGPVTPPTAAVPAFLAGSSTPDNIVSTHPTDPVTSIYAPMPRALQDASYAPVEVIPPGVMDMAQQAAAKDPTKMDVKQLAQVMEAAPLMRQFLEGVEKRIDELLKSGVTVPGFKLVQNPGRRGWALPEEEMVKKLTGMQIPVSALYKKTLLSPNQVETLVWDKKGEPQQLSDQQKKRMNQEYVSKSTGSISVAPESDSRPAVSFDASSMFGAVTPAVASVPPFLQATPVNVPDADGVSTFVAPPPLLEVPSFLKF